ncbi:MAG: ABC transporter substrate-binding protein [Flavobacteriales bacterium]|nr:ABC transporter substrate-binding protein [Flavobacteriales bacterium]
MKWPWALPLVLLAGCTAPSPPKTPVDDWRARTFTYARSFEVFTRGAERRIIVHGHGGAADTVGMYHAVPGGRCTEPGCRAAHLDIPLRRLALLSSTHVPFLAAVGARDAVVAVTFPDEVRDSVLRAAIAEGRVKGLGSTEALDRETLIALRPDAVLTYPFGAQQQATLKENGLPVVQVSEYLEEHPLGRAEWVRFFGSLTGREREADSLFAAIEQRYLAQAALAERDTVHPVVFFGSQWNGQWSVPPGNSYMARLIADAGGRYAFAHRTASGNIDIDMETLLATLDTVDNWGMIAAVDGHVFPRHLTNNDPRFNKLDVVRRFHFFAGNTRTADLFGQALLEPDQVLRDLRYCFGDAYLWRAWEVDHPYFAPLRPEPVTLPYRPEEVPLN